MFTVVFIYALWYLNEPITAPDSVNIGKGSGKDALTSLEKNHIDTNFLDVIVLKIIGGAKSGNISLEGATTRIELLKALAKGKEVKREILLIPGETTEIFLRNIADKYDLSLEKLKRSYYDKTSIPDGMLWPATYPIPKNSAEQDVISGIFVFSQKHYADLRNKYSVDEDELIRKIIVGSIIQKEAANNDEMPLIASVIYNRLDKGMPLQMDGSLNYGIYSHQKITPERIKNDQTSYNTYKNRGLPQYPVCNPSKEAIDAAFHPATTDYLYFVKGKNKTHEFSSTYRQHLLHIHD